VENTVCRHGLLAEHGLAFWIECGSKRILFDAGQTDVLRHNANHLAISLKSADAIVISHGHYDHTGCLAAATEARRKPPRSFVHPAALLAKYARHKDGTVRVIDTPAASRAALVNGTDIHWTKEPSQVVEGLWVTGPIPRLTDFEDTGGRLFKGLACRRPDNLIDDQAAFLDGPRGIVVILGCAHAGVINTLHYIQQLLPGRPIHTVIGGMHLVTVSETRTYRTVEALHELDIQRLVPLHCTGFAAMSCLGNEFSGRVSICAVGTRLDLGADS